MPDGQDLDQGYPILEIVESPQTFIGRSLTRSTCLDPCAQERLQPRVLVVDDSRLAREASVRLLSATGYQSVAAEADWEAWEILNERRFDAVVAALEMPCLDGLQLIARIRREVTLRGLPIIVLSSRARKARATAPSPPAPMFSYPRAAAAAAWSLPSPPA